MRFAILSDVHANLQAWNAVLLDIRSQELDRIVCLGDLVGYGPNPAEVLRSVHANVNHLVLGNHDAVVCGKLDDALFNDSARLIIEWTRTRLNRDARRFLATLPLSLDAGVFRCAHGDFSEPAAFNYILEPADALPSWSALAHRLLFVGHSHVPGIFLLGQSGTPRWVPPQDFEIEDGKRYLVNVGSVGQPRDGDTRASYCVFDSESGTLLWRRIPFDLDRYRDALLETGVPEQASHFLSHDPRRAVPPIRELLSFSPASSPDQAARNVVEVRELVDLQRSLRRWKRLLWVILAAAALLAAALGAAWFRHVHRALDIEGPMPTELNAASAAPERNLLVLPTAAIPSLQPIPGWTIHLGDRRKQSAAVDLDGGKPVLTLSSRTALDPIAIASHWIAAAPGMTMSSEAVVQTGERFRGHIELVVSLRKTVGGTDTETTLFDVKEPNRVRRRDGGFLAKSTTDPLPAGTTAVRFSIRGQFEGRAEIRDALFRRRP